MSAGSGAVELLQSSASQLVHVLSDTFNKPRVQKGLAILGLVWSTRWLLDKTCKAGSALRIYVLQPLFARQRNWRELGEWAVVTGSTDGIGLEFARQLASHGMNIVLISRNPEKLEKVALEIRTEFNVATRTIACNFSQAAVPTYEKIAEELRDLDIGVLVNNVGVYLPHPQPFSSTDMSVLWDHVSVNCGATTMMTRIVLPTMKRQKRGGIINISSLAALYPMALMSSYSASKIYVDYLSAATRKELTRDKIHNVQILNLHSGYVATNIVKFNYRFLKPSFYVPSSQSFVKSALGTFGLVDSCAGYFTHAIQIGIFNTCAPLFHLLIDPLQTVLWREAERDKNNAKL